MIAGKICLDTNYHESLLELREWLIESKQLIVFVDKTNSVFTYEIIDNLGSSIENELIFPTFFDALESGIEEAFSYI